MNSLASFKKLEKSVLAQLQPAVFALVVELIYADGEPADAEWNELRCELAGLFDLPDELVMEALSEAAAAPARHDLRDACMVIANVLSPQQKGELILLLWRVAFADSVIDTGELKMLRTIANDIGLTNGEFASLRNQVREA